MPAYIQVDMYIHIRIQGVPRTLTLSYLSVATGASVGTIEIEGTAGWKCTRQNNDRKKRRWKTWVRVAIRKKLKLQQLPQFNYHRAHAFWNACVLHSIRSQQISSRWKIVFHKAKPEWFISRSFSSLSLSKYKLDYYSIVYPAVYKGKTIDIFLFLLLFFLSLLLLLIVNHHYSCSCACTSLTT